MFKEIFIWLSQKLSPNGFAFRMPEPLRTPDAYITETGSIVYTDEIGATLTTEYSPIAIGGVYHRLHESIAIVQEQTHNDALSILDSIVADNSNFTIEDAHAWYIRLGIYDSGTVPLADMMLAINQKLNYPGAIIYGRSHYTFIRDQLIAAGFGITLLENNFGGSTRTPGKILNKPYGTATYGTFQYGQTDYKGSTEGVTKLVNYLEEDKDEHFVISPNYRSTFYIFGIGGYGTFANIPLSRKTEFRQLLLQLKPAQTVAFLFVNYV